MDNIRRVRVISASRRHEWEGWLIETYVPVHEGGPSSPPDFVEVPIFVPNDGHAPFYLSTEMEVVEIDAMP